MAETSLEDQIDKVGKSIESGKASMRNLKQTAVYLQGNFVIGNFRLSAISTLVETEPPQLEDFKNIIETIRRRSHAKQRALVSAVIGEEDFVPISFLETGIKRSAPVCRIARYFDHPSFLNFVKELVADIEKLNNVPHGFNTPEKIIEVFSIPQKIAQALFDDSAQQKN